MSKEIVLRYVTNAITSGITFKFKTLRGARKKVYALFGANPHRDPDGYAVNKYGNCLFVVSGASYEDIFPAESTGK